MAGMGEWEDAETGVRRRILQAQGRLMLMEVRFAAGAAGYEHSHVHEQISYCIAGRFEYSLDGRNQVLAEGQSIYVPSNARHGAKALEAGSLDRRVHAGARGFAGPSLSLTAGDAAADGRETRDPAEQGPMHANSSRACSCTMTAAAGRGATPEAVPLQRAEGIRGWRRRLAPWMPLSRISARRSMQEPELRALIEDVRTGELPRRSFIQRMVGLGLTAPMASMMLMHAGVAKAQPAPAYKPTKRGGGGALKVLWWQGATLLQPHFANGTKDQEGSRIFYEPLAVWDNDGNLVPILAAEIPSRENGGVLEGGKVGALAPEEGRDLARRQALHRRRLRLHLGVRARPGDRRASRSASTRTSPSPRSIAHHPRLVPASRRRSGPRPSSPPRA